MKPTVTLHIGSTPAHVADYRLLLDLGGCGRGFITAECDADCTGQLVRLNLGVNDTVYRWFVGYVERCGPAERGYKRLFVRELVGVLAKTWPVSLQHPTLRDVCAAITAQTDIAFALPDANYVDTKIPHFKAAGSGYALLDSLGAAFSIADYCWYQLADGTVYAGSYADSRFAGAPVDIPEDFIKAGSSGSAMQLAIIPAIRPGVIVNGRRIHQVEIDGADMFLRWQPLTESGRPAWDSPEKRQIDRAYPELAAGLHLPRRARVTGPTDVAALGDQADPFRPRYAVNLQLLDADGNDATAPELIAVPLPVPFAGAEGGLYQFPGEGTLVEVAFSDGRPDRPFIRQTLQDDQPLPAIKPGEQLQQQRAGVSQRITTAGSWQRETDQAIEESSSSRSVTSDHETRETVTRSVLIKSTDSTTVLGMASLMAGAVLQLADGDFSVGAAGKYSLRSAELQKDIAGDVVLNAAGRLQERIAGIRSSVAAAQQIQGDTVTIGDGKVNLLDCLTDTLDIVHELASLTAAHTHSNTGTPTNADAIVNNAQRPVALAAKYGPLIGDN